MLDLILYSVAAWFMVGLVGAALILVIQGKRGDENLAWPLIGFALSFIGLLLFYLLVLRRPPLQEQYPARPRYEPPSYKFGGGEEAAPVAAPEKEDKRVKQVEGAPRCEKCGSAISLHDFTCPGCGKELRVGF
jgi:hypothetical protein